LLALLGQAVDLVGDVDRRFVLNVTQLLDLRFKFCDGLLKLKEMPLAHAWILRPGLMLDGSVELVADGPDPGRVSLVGTLGGCA
jgi:hypothetical protein